MVILLAVIYTMLTPSQPAEQLYYSDIVDMFRGEEVKSFRIEGSTLLLELREEAADGTPRPSAMTSTTSALHKPARRAHRRAA